MSAGRFIVMFKETASEAEIQKFKEEAVSDGGKVTQSYSLIKGFAAELQPQTLTRFNNFKAEEDSIIDVIEPDGIVTTQK